MRSILAAAIPIVCLLTAVPLWAQNAELIEKEETVEKRAKAGGAWGKADVGTAFVSEDRIRTGELSRAVVRLSDKSELRLDEFTEAVIEPAKSVNINSGGGYFFSREKAASLEIRTPAVNGALRGTQIVVRVAKGGRTTMTLLEGELDLANKAGSLQLRSGEQAEIVPGSAPRKTAVIEAADVANLVQWALYYPAVIPPGEFGLSEAQQRALGQSFALYEEGDLLGALRTLPRNAPPLYRAAVLLSVGRVDKAHAALRGVAASNPSRRALEKVIASVKREASVPGAGSATTSAEWIAESYWQQSQSNLEAARNAARHAAQAHKLSKRGPTNGIALARLAELEFSFGNTAEAKEHLSRALELTPRNAQAHAIRGFLLSAENNITEARAAFDEAIRLDSALGSAWLGRGLTKIKRGHAEDGRRDLHTAAVLEPTRSLFHSYLGKAFSNEAGKLFRSGDDDFAALANKDLARAAELDPDDPTPPLYTAIQRKQENRYNDAVAQLEHSLALNDNRRIYRSQFLLDQDKGVRSANLASIYQNAGMTEVAVREAVRAVNADYGSAAAHLFLANSYDALRDPRRVLLRYETPWFNEQLLANILSPVGGGPLSQFVSAQEYSKLLEADGLGFNIVSEYRSTGEFRTTGSQYGTFGNIAYALDADYQYDNGRRPNNDLSRFEGYATFKFQLTPADSVLFQTKFQDYRAGDTSPRFDDTLPVTGPALTQRFTEQQSPGFLLAAWHHEWSPGNHTILLGSWLKNEQTFSARGTSQLQLTRDIGALIPPDADPGEFPSDADLEKRGLAARGNVPNILAPLAGRGTIREQPFGFGLIPAVTNERFDFDRTAELEILSAELQQIITLNPHTIILGARIQSGEFDTLQRLTVSDPLLRTSGAYFIPAADQHAVVDFDRLTLYAYDHWRIAPWLTLHAGLTWDNMQYPENFRVPPISDQQRSVDRVSPKIGFTLAPSPLFTMRGVYTEFVSGVSFDESIRLEPTQMAGFAQAFRSTISEDLLGSVEAAKYKVTGLSIESKLPTRTYLGAEFTQIEQTMDRSIGVFDILNHPEDPRFLGVLPSQTEEKTTYREQSLTITANQLLGENWALGARYRHTRSHLEQSLPEISRAILPSGTRDLTARLNEGSLYALYNHHSGFFARAEANWYRQENENYDPATGIGPGDDFWMFNAWAGYRFAQNRCDISAGVLNLTDTDYQMNPLSPLEELPHERTFVVRCRMSF